MSFAAPRSSSTGLGLQRDASEASHTKADTKDRLGHDARRHSGQTTIAARDRQIVAALQLRPPAHERWIEPTGTFCVVYTRAQMPYALSNSGRAADQCVCIVSSDTRNVDLSRNPARDAAFHAGVLLARSRGPTLRSCLALAENPDQRALWMNDFENIAPTAVEEIVRWATRPTPCITWYWAPVPPAQSRACQWFLWNLVDLKSIRWLTGLVPQWEENFEVGADTDTPMSDEDSQVRSA